MGNKLKIAIIQTDILWESPSENLENYTSKISSLNSSVELVVLPEMFATGFTMNASKVKQTMNGEIATWMKNTAVSKKLAIYGSIIIEENNKLLNRALFVFPSGDIEYYDKKHLFTLVGEEKLFSSGSIRKIITYKGWRIMPQVCYDLRFPVWSRNNLEYDLLIYIASWPERRSYAWQTLLKARAIENMSYVVGVNRIGSDGNSITYSGDSAVIDNMGNDISNIHKYEDCTVSVIIDKEKLEKDREKFGFLNDGDIFEISTM